MQLQCSSSIVLRASPNPTRNARAMKLTNQGRSRSGPTATLVKSAYQAFLPLAHPHKVVDHIRQNIHTHPTSHANVWGTETPAWSPRSPQPAASHLQWDNQLAGPEQPPSVPAEREPQRPSVPKQPSHNPLQVTNCTSYS